MPQFLTNSTTNSVVYSPGTWTTKILGKTQEVASSTTEVSIPEFKIALGKYERMLIKYRIHWDQNTTGRAKFKLDTPTVTDAKSSWTGVEADNTLIATISAGADPTYTHDVAGTSGYLELEVVIENDATAGDINFQFAQVASNAAATKVLRGSYVEYRRF
tara:strand:+ start:280 stop:759 length:480 start_codon:yes stop_codon:yes gene_type:complete